jgi:hypothetical protein
MTITDFYRSNRLDKLISKICPNKRYQEDLKQELILHLMEKDEEILNNLLKTDQIYYYCAKYLKNQYHSSTSPFFKKYRNFYELDSDIEHKSSGEEQKVINQVEKILEEKVDFFSSFLFREYYYEWYDEKKGETVLGNSYRKIEEKYSLNSNFKMDHLFVYNSIRKTMKTVKEELNKNK